MLRFFASHLLAGLFLFLVGLLIGSYAGYSVGIRDYNDDLTFFQEKYHKLADENRQMKQVLVGSSRP